MGNSRRYDQRKFDRAFKRPEAKTLLRSDWKKLNENSPHATGFCYLGAEAAFHLLGGKQAGIKVYCASYEEDGMKCTHWWLVKGKKIIDPTASQYRELGLEPPYHLGKRMGFLTSKPSKRAAALMEMLK